MIDQIARRIIDRIKQEVSAFIDETGDDPSTETGHGGLIADVRDHLGALIAEDHQLRKELDLRRGELSELQDKIELAISSDREDLARAAFIRRNGLKRQMENLTIRLNDIEAESLEIEALISELSSANNASPQNGDREPDPGLSAQLRELEDLANKVGKQTGEPKNDGA